MTVVPVQPWYSIIKFACINHDTIQVEYNSSSSDHTGHCEACMCRSCPVRALVDPTKLWSGQLVATEVCSQHQMHNIIIL